MTTITAASADALARAIPPDAQICIGRYMRKVSGVWAADIEMVERGSR